MKSDEDVISLINQAFASCVRPEHFTNYKHCEECAEHDELLRNRTLANISIEDVGNPGWDPICFCTPEAKAYLMPALARLSLDPPTYSYGWYGEQLMFHLWSGGESNAFFLSCNKIQRQAISELMKHYIETKPDSSNTCTDEIFLSLEFWSK